MTKTDFREVIKLLKYASNKIAKETTPLDYKASDMIRRINKILKKYDNGNATQ